VALVEAEAAEAEHQEVGKMLRSFLKGGELLYVTQKERRFSKETRNF
jgi:hypothetical protein